MGHNHNGKAESWALASYVTCAYCRADGSGAGHVTVSCTCGAKGVFCEAHQRTDWGEYSGETCADVRRRMRAEEEAIRWEEEAEEDRAREKEAERKWARTHRYRYVCEGQTYFPEGTTLEEAEKAAVEYTHAGWDEYLPAPVPVVYWITDMESGEETQYSEICGPKQEPEPECTDAEGHKWETLYREEDHEGDHCPKCGRYRRRYRAEPKRGLPEFSEYLDSL